MRHFTVKAGDYLTQIAEQEYGSESDWTDIASANHLQPPYTLYAGEVLVIPILHT